MHFFPGKKIVERAIPSDFAPGPEPVAATYSFLKKERY
jgi:hypothetical protein